MTATLSPEEFRDLYEEATNTDDPVEAIEACRQMIHESLKIARQALRAEGEWERAKGHWWAHIRTALDDDHLPRQEQLHDGRHDCGASRRG